MKKPRLRSDVIREGDRVIIRGSRFVERCGYPKTVADYLPEVRARRGLLFEYIRHMLDIAPIKISSIPHFGYDGMDTAPNPVYRKTVERIEMQIAWELAQKDNFGGRERSLHFKDCPEFAGRTVTVERVVTMKTGVYYPSGGSGMYADDYEPGGLADEKRHRVAFVHNGEFSRFRVDDIGFLVSDLEKSPTTVKE